MPVLAYGLRTDFQAELFEGSQYLLAWADDIREIKTICHCGKKATMVVRTDEAGRALADGEQILVGGNERYVSLCRLHFRRAMKMPGCEECATPAPAAAAKPSVGVDATLALDLDDLADAAAGGSPEM